MLECYLWWGNVVKYGKYSLAKFANFVCISITQRNSYQFRGNLTSKMVTFYIQNLETSQGYIFRILQHFATNFCNSTNFLAVVKDFVFFA